MPIDKIICVGKNYLDHARELGDAVPDKPVIFLKPASVLKQAKNWQEQLQVSFPINEHDVQPECEIALQISRGGFNLTIEEAANSIGAVTLGLDMTLRARQAILKKMGHPWTTAKVFPDAAILGPWIPADQFTTYLETEFKLLVNGAIKQHSVGKHMMMKPIELLVYISQFFPLCAGDIIFTGTPAGVSSIAVGDVAELQWGGYGYSVAYV